MRKVKAVAIRAFYALAPSSPFFTLAVFVSPVFAIVGLGIAGLGIQATQARPERGEG